MPHIFPKIAGKSPDYTACKYLRQMLANTDSSVNMQLIFTFYKILFLTKLGKIIKLKKKKKKADVKISTRAGSIRNFREPSRHTPRRLPEQFPGAGSRFWSRFARLYKARRFAISAFLDS